VKKVRRRSARVLFELWRAPEDVGLAARAWDPYPFILLNLFLSMLAAVQAPIIMMSPNRQDAKDRLRSEVDFAVNRKAEAEIIQFAASSTGSRTGPTTCRTSSPARADHPGADPRQRGRAGTGLRRLFLFSRSGA
jgi:hypothetical protein